MKRDTHCWHCGTELDLVPHHRKNRGAGGSKLLDTLDNLMLVCAVYNGAMESDANVAQKAREYGHKLRSWENMKRPVFDIPTSTWYLLDEKGEKHEFREGGTPTEGDA